MCLLRDNVKMHRSQYDICTCIFYIYFLLTMHIFNGAKSDSNRMIVNKLQKKSLFALNIFSAYDNSFLLNLIQFCANCTKALDKIVFNIKPSKYSAYIKV